MSRADQRGTTITEVLVGIMLLGYVTAMLLQIVASANSADAKLRARTEAWQTLNALAAPAQYVDCTQPSRLAVCEPGAILPPVSGTLDPSPLAPSLYVFDGTYMGKFGTYTITLDDLERCMPDTSGSPPTCSTGSVAVPTRTVTVEWQPDGSLPEIIDHTVYGPWS